jgi:hypothetical protein
LEGQTIKGIVKHNSKPTANVSVILKNQNEKHALKYTITNNKGEFEFLHLTLLDSLTIEFNSMQFKTKVIKLSSIEIHENIYNLEVELEERITKLKEVVVTSNRKPILIKKDTVIYNANSFKRGDERVVEDIIRNLPGIEIESDGIIRYKGKEIKKLLVDGDDLFGSNYQIGTKNIDADMIEAVQAIENFSENDLLKNISDDSENVAINLIINKEKGRVSNTTKLGAGIKDRLDLANNRLNVSHNTKGFTTLSYNNIGVNNSPYNSAPGSAATNSLSDKRLLSNKSNRLIEEGVHNPLARSNKGNNNNTFFANVSSAIKMSKQTKATLNIGYYNDRIKGKLTDQTIFIIDDSTNYERTTTKVNKMRPQRFQFNANVIHKINNNKSIEYTGIIDFEKINSSINLINLNSKFYSSVNSESFFNYNKIDFTYKIDNTQAIQLTTLYSLNGTPQELELDPGYNFNSNSLNPQTSNQQNSRFDKEIIKLRAVYYKSFLNAKLSYLVSMGKAHNQYWSQLYDKVDNNIINSEANFNNEFDYDINTLDLGLSYLYKKDLWFYNARLILTNDYINFESFDTNLKQYKLNPNTTLMLGRKLDGMASAQLSYKFEKQKPNENRLFQKYVLKSFSNLERNQINFDYLVNHKFNISYNYNDIINLFKLNTNFSIQTSSFTYLKNTEIGEYYNYQTNFFSPEKTEQYYFQLDLEKFVPLIKSTIGIDVLYLMGKYKNIINNSDLRDNKLNNLKAIITINSGFKGRFNYLNEFTFNQSTIHSKANLQSTNIVGFENWLSLFYRSSKNLNLKVTYDLIKPSKDSKLASFLDFSINYTKNKLYYSITGSNLLNNSSFTQQRISDFYYNYSNTELMKPYIIFSVTFKI